MPQSICPYLTRWDGSQQRATPIDYPSFENHCPALGDEIPLLLADQATFCLSGSHHYCQRYTALQAEAQQLSVPDLEEADALRWSQPTPMPAMGATPARPIAAETAASWPTTQPESRHATPSSAWASTRWWTWAGAGLFFITVLLIGSLYAAYTGWQLALANLAEARAGEVNTLANGGLQPTPYVVFVTATSPALPATAAPAVAQVVAAATTDAVQVDPNNFPAAVTATPIIVVPLPANETAATSVPQNTILTGRSDSSALANAAPAAPSNIQLPPAEATVTPVIDVYLPVPPPRNTPVFDIPTSTAAPVEPTATATQTPRPAILGTPVVVFAPDKSFVPPGECTRLRWHVENVREVYYENLPSLGDGTHEECIKDKADTYALTVVYATGQTKIYTATVDVLWPTDTPEPTPTFTPEIEPTQTWTPVPPTATPTPNVVYGVTLAVDGGNSHSCTAGTACEIGLFATNAGDSADNVSIELLAAGSWSALICRQDGVCAQNKLTLSTVGPGNTAFVKLRIEIPAETVGQASEYALRAISEGSGGAMVSQVVTINVTVAN